MKISLCLLVWNELQGCQTDVPNIPVKEFEEIFAVDGGSTDGTVEYLRSQGISVHRQPKPGLNAAYVHANDMARSDAVVVFFPKGTLPREDLLKFRSFFEKGHDLVIASRQLPGSINEEDAQFWRPRKWAVFWLSILAAALWCREGEWIRDVQHGFKGWRRSAFARMKVFDYGGSVDLEMVVRAYKLHMPRMEFPSKEKKRFYGESHFKFGRVGQRLARYLWLELFRRD